MLSVLGLLVVLLVGLGFTVQLVLGERLRAQIEERLEDRASAATALIGTVSNSDLADRLSAQGVAVLIEGADGGSVVAGPSPDQLRRGPSAIGPLGSPGASGTAADPRDPAAPASTAPAAATAPTSAPTSAVTAPTAGSTITVTSSTVTSDAQLITLTSQLSDGTALTLTADASSVGQTLDQLRWIMIAASALFLLIAAGALQLVVGRSLRPLTTVTALARDIARGDRGRRLHPDRGTTEIGSVATAFDEMLDGVEGAEQQALAAEQQARDSEQRVRTFVSDAAHELRTPVAGMAAAADTLVRASLSRDEQERLASHVVREAGRASRLIDDMLMMARVDRGLVLETRQTDLATVVQLEVDRQSIRRPGLDLVVSAPDAPLLVEADPERLAQIIANLVDNAARMTGGAGCIELALHALKRPAAATHAQAAASRPSDRFVRLTVTDNGPGVPAADRERIFDRLVRLDSGRNRAGNGASGGAGLGLPIARGIARAHGGDLVCEPRSSGAAFVLTLPAL